MKTLCFFAGNIDFGGGTERSLSLVTNELANRGYMITILNLWGGEKPFFAVAPGITVHALFDSKVSFARNFIGAILRLRKYLRAHAVDVLVSVESSQSLYALPASFGTGVRNINWEHFNCTVDLGFFPRRVARRMAARFSDDIVVLTARDKALWRARLGADANVKVIPNAISFPVIENAPESRENIVLAVGRFTYQKGFDLLVQAWELARRQGLDDWQLWIVGDGEDKEKLSAVIASMNLGGSVVIHDPTSNISEYYRRAKWFCLSSRFEGLPMVLLEACAWGLPIVAFDCDTGPAEIVTDKVNGFLCAAGDVAALAARLSTAVSLTDEAHQAMAKASTATAKRFELPAIGDMWVRLLKDA
jgi:glycosyltransferase involved in cell wall biosynthesis